MNKLRDVWRSATWPLRACAILFVAIVVGYAFFSAANVIHSRRYTRQLQAAEARAIDAEKKASAMIGEANDANAKAAMMEMELKKISQVVLDLNSDLAQAQARTQTVRKIYVHSKETPQPAIVLTGNAFADSLALCAELAKAGFPCEARR